MEKLEKITLAKGTNKILPQSFNEPFNKGIRIPSNNGVIGLKLSIIDSKGRLRECVVDYLGAKLNANETFMYQLLYDELTENKHIEVYFSDTNYDFDDSIGIPRWL